MSRYHTNLAAEFYVLSCLHRIGLDAHLTLGNRKGVDIVVVRDAGDAITIEVKGLAGKYEWPAGNLNAERPESHFVVLVSFEGRIDASDMPPPRAWVVPFPRFTISSGTIEPARMSHVLRSPLKARSSKMPGG